jgi:glycerol-1-phosphate dehydrogenase [NAD(P)+]
VTTRLDATLRSLLRDAPGATAHVEVGPDMLPRAAQWLAARHPDHGDVVVCDPNTAAAAGERFVAACGNIGRPAQLRVIAPGAGEPELVCDDHVIDELASWLAEHPQLNAVAVGAGTINDIVKMATTKLGRPFQSIATAASMNGYTSAIAAVLSRGVKRTLPTRSAEAVFADVGVLCRAPARLNLAGFGDLLSKPYSHADWRLSHLVRGVAYAEGPARLLDEAYEAMLEHAPSIGRAEPAGIDLLMRTILLSGFTMALAGTSAPASGGEHLVSHYWDMEQHCGDLPLLGLHGTQVGIATRISAHLFDRLVALPVEAIDPEAAAARRPDAGWIDGLAGAHPRLTPAVVAEVQAQIRTKQRHGDALRDEIGAVRNTWPEIQRSMREVLVPAQRIEAGLRAAGAADRPTDLGVDRAHAVATLRVCRHIRDRYVALDLADDLGFLDGWAAEIVDLVEA